METSRKFSNDGYSSSVRPIEKAAAIEALFVQLAVAARLPAHLGTLVLG
ncbi:MAG TPA: hypothetical protein VKO66_01360 [Sideroxyarcus sp.]|nr:hypothetical protein [Sideroxyarcus sp.]